MAAPWRLRRLEATVADLGLAVVTIDGLGYSVGRRLPQLRQRRLRLSALAGVAERTGATIVGLTHPPKGNSDAVTAAIGSTAFTGGGLLVRCGTPAGARYFGHQRVPAGAAILRGGRLPGSEIGELLLGEQSQ